MGGSEKGRRHRSRLCESSFLALPVLLSRSLLSKGARIPSLPEDPGLIWPVLMKGFEGREGSRLGVPRYSGSRGLADTLRPLTARAGVD